MTARRLGLAALLLVAVVLQSAVVERLPLPGSPPDLVLVLVVVVGLLEGPRTAMLTGFAGGLLADLLSDHQLGRLALAYVLVGFVAGLLQDDAGGSAVVVPAVVGAGGAALAVLVFAGHGVLLDDARVTGGALWRSLASVVPYCAALTPVVVPPVAALLRRADRRP